MFKLALLAALVGLAVAGGHNKCPWAMGKYPFDEQKMVGTWNVVAGIPHGKNGNLRCAKFDYQVTKDNHVIGFSGLSADGKAIKSESYGSPIFGKPEKSANLMSVWRKEDGTYTSVYKQAIVATDYDNYAVMIACKPIFDEATKTFSRHVKAGILSRKLTLSNETLDVLMNVVSSYDIDLTTLQLMDQTNC